MLTSQIISGPSRVLRLGINAYGRDFVVGDIHGAYDLVWAAMRAVKFDPTRDRLFCVGDFIDRGLGSARALKFLQQPYVYGVAGNHEMLFLEAWRGNVFDREIVDALAALNHNGMAWMRGVEIDHLVSMAHVFEALPYVIEVETANGIVGILHADVPANTDWPTFVQQVDVGDAYVTRMALGMDLDGHYHESRQRVEQERMDGVEGVHRVFVGHTVVFAGLKCLGNLIACDSGACYGDAGKGKGFLTMVELGIGNEYLQSPKFGEYSLLDIRTKEKECLFLNDRATKLPASKAEYEMSP